jgi:hypothetical protein
MGSDTGIIDKKILIVNLFSAKIAGAKLKNFFIEFFPPLCNP